MGENSEAITENLSKIIMKNQMEWLRYSKGNHHLMMVEHWNN